MCSFCTKFYATGKNSKIANSSIKQNITTKHCNKDTFQQDPKYAYHLGMINCKNKKYQQAIKHFTDCYIVDPLSDEGFKAMVMECYCYYKQGNYIGAISAAKDVIYIRKDKIEDDNTIYIKYLQILCGVESFISPDYDISSISSIQDAAVNFLNNHGSSKYYNHVKQVCIPFLQNALLAKDMYVGRHYLKHCNPAGSVNRFLDVLQANHNMFQPEALYRLIEAYVALGLDDFLKDQINKYLPLISYPEGAKNNIWHIKALKLIKKYSNN